MKNIGLIFGIGISILIFGGLNYYIGLRGWQRVGSLIPFLDHRVYWIIFWLIAFSMIAARVAEKYLPETLEHCIVLIGDYYMGAMLYLLILLPIIDIIRFTDRKISFIPKGIRENRILSSYIGVFVLALIVILLIYGSWNAKNIKITHYEVHIDKKAGELKGINIAMLSDAHLGSIVNNKSLENMVEKINSLKPDIVLMCGDIIDEKAAPFLKQSMGETMKKIKAPYGVYAVTGNHEFYGRDSEKIVKALEESNIKMLRDESMKINNSFYVAGREDLAGESYLKHKRKSAAELLGNTEKQLPIILLDHQPSKLKEAEEAGVDLQLSGHTHRGQMFPNQYFTKLLYEVDYGYKKKGNYNIIVSSGIGTWGPPIRIYNNSELVDIKVSFRQ